eukprot:jgi/Mesvir1/14404/Mv09790-RA.1
MNPNAAISPRGFPISSPGHAYVPLAARKIFAPAIALQCTVALTAMAARVHAANAGLQLSSQQRPAFSRACQTAGQPARKRLVPTVLAQSKGPISSSGQNDQKKEARHETVPTALPTRRGLSTAIGIAIAAACTAAPASAGVFGFMEGVLDIQREKARETYANPVGLARERVEELQALVERGAPYEEIRKQLVDASLDCIPAANDPRMAVGINSCTLDIVQRSLIGLAPERAVADARQSVTLHKQLIQGFKNLSDLFAAQHAATGKIDANNAEVKAAFSDLLNNLDRYKVTIVKALGF